MKKTPIKKTKKFATLKQLFLRRFFTSTLMGLVFAGLFSATVFVFATPPTSQYSPGETLNPSCAVGATNCSTVSPVPYSGATAAVDLGSQNLTTTGTSALGATTSLKYNSTNYCPLTAASNGDLTIATTSATTGGNINISSAVTGDFTLLSNSGTLVLGGTGNSNNESLKFDFETYADKAAVTSATGVSEIDFGSLNLTTTGILTLGGSTSGTLVTRVKAGAATESDTNGSLVVDSSNGRLYFRYGAAWHYVAQTAGFQIPDFETIDPISGDQIEEGDIVLGMINQTFEDNALHGVWVKWDSVKANLIKELKGELPADTFNGGWTGGASMSGGGAGTELFSEKIKNGLFSLGISVQNGLAIIKELATEKFSAKVARIEQLEMVDKNSGIVYCTWIQDGDWQKAEGECGSVQVAVAPLQQVQQQEIETQEIVEQVKEDLKPQLESKVQGEVAQQVREQVKEEIKEQVQEQVQEEIQEQVQVQVESQLENLEPAQEVQREEKPDEPSIEIEPAAEPAAQKGEPRPTEVGREPEPETEVIQPEEIQPSPVDTAVEETSAALLNGTGRFIAWAAGAVIPKEVKQFTLMVFEFGQTASGKALAFAWEIPQVAQKSTAGLMSPFKDLGDFMMKKY